MLCSFLSKHSILDKKLFVNSFLSNILLSTDPLFYNDVAVFHLDVITRLFELMKESGTTKAQLERICGLSNGVILKWEKGLQKPSLDAVSKIAKHFNVSIDYLTGQDHATRALHIPDELKGMKFAFHRNEFDDLTQAEVENLAQLAVMLKNNRKGD